MTNGLLENGRSLDSVIVRVRVALKRTAVGW